MKENLSPRVLVLGLDGATFTLLAPWAKQGKLPNLAELMRIGAQGMLESSVPPYTAAAWVSLATGKGPGKHGIADFWQLTSDRRRVLVSSKSIKSQTLWSILSNCGRRVAVINVPMTYPPFEVNGVMVAGMMTPNEQVDYTYPSELKSELLAIVGDYSANPYASMSQSAEFLRKVQYWVKKREEANRYLLAKDNWDFFMNVTQAPDPIQHQFWKFLDSQHPHHRHSEAAIYANLLLGCYQIIDEIVGHRISMLDDRTVLLVVSDHGFGPAHKLFLVNRFLADLGLLAFSRRLGFLGDHLRLVRASTLSLLQVAARRVDILGLRTRLLDNRVREQIRQSLDRAASPPIDWSRTKAYYGGLTGECIYVNLKGREERGVVEPGEEYEKVRDLIIRELRQLSDPDTGEPVVSAVYRREDIYHGERVPFLPDVIFSIGSRPYLPSERLSASTVMEPLSPGQGGGRHRPDGIFLAAGMGIKKGHVINGARIVDVAPTILYALGLPMPEDMDGRILTEIFEPDYLVAHLAKQTGTVPTIGPGEPEDTYTAEEIEAVQARLRALGYTE